MRSLKFTQTNSAPFSGLNGTLIMGDGTGPHNILIESIEGLGAPPLALQSQKAPFQNGESVIRTLFSARTIEVVCAITIPGNSPANVALVTERKRAISKLLSPVGMGYLPKTSASASLYDEFLGLLSYASDGVNYDRFINAVPLSAPEFPNKYYSDGFQRFRVVFFCPDPFWRSALVTQSMVVPVPPVAGTYANLAYSPDLGYSVICDTSTGFVYNSYDAVNFDHIGTLPTSGGNAIWDGVRSTFYIFDQVAGTYSSPDGANWTLVDSNPAENGVSCNGRMLVFAPTSSFSSTYHWTSDGTTFTAGTLPGSAKITGCAFADGVGTVVLVGYVSGPTNVTYYGYDGLTWQTGTFSSVASQPTALIWAESASRYVCFFGSYLEVSDNGSSFSAAVSLGGSYAKPAWSNSLSILMALPSSTSGASLIWTDDFLTVHTVSLDFNVNGPAAWIDGMGLFCIFPPGGSNFPAISYNGKTAYRVSSGAFGSAIVSSLVIPAGTTLTTGGPVAIASSLSVTIGNGGKWIITNAGVDLVAEIENDGDAPTDFELTIPIFGYEIDKKVVVSDNFVWDGIGTPPSDHNLVISTEGLGPGSISVNTAFGKKDIIQYGESKIQNFVAGTFFQLYVSGVQKNYLYVRNTGITAGIPVVKYRKRYIGV